MIATIAAACGGFDEDGPLAETLADLAAALQNPPSDQEEPFLVWADWLDYCRRHTAPKAPPPPFRRVQPGELVILEESRIRGRLIRKPEFPPPREIPGDVP